MPCTSTCAPKDGWHRCTCGGMDFTDAVDLTVVHFATCKSCGNRVCISRDGYVSTDIGDALQYLAARFDVSVHAIGSVEHHASLVAMIGEIDEEAFIKEYLEMSNG